MTGEVGVSAVTWSELVKEDLGFRYHKGALVSEKDSEGAPINLEPPTFRRREYIPSTDLVELLLIIVPIKASYRLAHAALAVKVTDGHQITVKVRVMWPNGTVNGDAITKTSLAPWENYVEVLEALKCSNHLRNSSWNGSKGELRYPSYLEKDGIIAFQCYEKLESRS
ncbi:hypothetical protein Tco_0819038 [Tanacetum coccineum]|uniref:Uncharacterized protein n=1 Tax=Tanacetum coccineum TaxID=301880 RepID=A0ABQ5A9Q8_9ASTR